jgi:hypothetical protein
MDHDDDVSAIKSGTAVTSLLVGSIPTVLGVAKGVESFFERNLHSVIRTVIVNHETAVCLVCRDLLGNERKSLGSVVRGKDNVNLGFASAIRHQWLRRALLLHLVSENHNLVTKGK